MITFLLFVIVALLVLISIKLLHIEKALVEFIIYHGSRR